MFAIKSVARSQLLFLDQPGHWSQNPNCGPEAGLHSESLLLVLCCALSQALWELARQVVEGESSFLESLRSMQLIAFLADYRCPGGNAEERTRTGRSKEEAGPDPPTAV